MLVRSQLFHLLSNSRRIRVSITKTVDWGETYEWEATWLTVELSPIAFFLKFFYDFIQINPISDIQIIHDYLSSQFQYRERT